MYKIFSAIMLAFSIYKLNLSWDFLSYKNMYVIL